MNPDLVKEILSAEKMFSFNKEKETASVFFAFIKKSLIAIDGTEWKHRKKLLSKVFNYDFIASHIPTMVRIADTVF